jgi:hypothetical protein
MVIGIKRAFIIVATCAATALSLGPPAQAAPVGSGGCPGGYYAAYSNSSWAGGATATETSASQQWNEMTGLGCYRRVSGTVAYVTFQWGAIGHIYSGSFNYQIINCTTGGLWNGTLAYPNGSGSATNGNSGATQGVGINSAYSYKLRIRGDGSFQRNPDGSGAIGYYGSVNTGAIAPFQNDTACV